MDVLKISCMITNRNRRIRRMNTFKKIGIVAVVMAVICMLPVAAMATNEILIGDPFLQPDTSKFIGTAIWDAASSTLTLNNARLEGYIFVTQDCRINLVGTNTIAPSGYISGIEMGDAVSITFCGDGTLTVTSPYAALTSGIYQGNFIFESGTVNALVTGTTDPAVSSQNSIVINQGATLTAESNSSVAVEAASSIEINGTLIAEAKAASGVAIKAPDVSINGKPATPDILESSRVEVNKPAPIPAAPVSAPKTGDSTPIMLLAALMIMSAAVLFATKKRTA